MGEAADRLKRDGSPYGAVDRVSGEIDTLRGDLGNLVAELDRRRHDAFDFRLQMRRHPVAVAVSVAATALVAGSLLALVARARRRRHRPSVRVRETRQAMARLLEHPERVACEASTGQKIAAAVGTLVATTLVKRLLLARSIERTRAALR